MIRKALLCLVFTLPLSGFAFVSSNYVQHCAIHTARGDGTLEKKLSCKASDCSIQSSVTVKVLFKKVNINTKEVGHINEKGNFDSSTLTVIKNGGTPKVVDLADNTYSPLSFVFQVRTALADNHPLIPMQVYYEGDIVTFTPTLTSAADAKVVTVQADTSSGDIITYEFDAARQFAMIGNTITKENGDEKLSMSNCSFEFI